MKKLFALLLTLTMVLSVCAFASAEEPVTITFWHTYGDAETPVIDEVKPPTRTSKWKPSVRAETSTRCW